MFQYILRRIYLFIFTLLILTLICYSVYSLAFPEQHPSILGWFDYLIKISTFNFSDTKLGARLIEESLIAFPATFELCVFGIGLALLIGIPVGTIAGMRQGSNIDNVISFIAMIGYSIPVFWLSLLISMLMSNTNGFEPNGIERYRIGESFAHITGFTILDLYLSDLDNKFELMKEVFLSLLLPSLMVAFAPMTEIIRLMRNIVAEVKQQNYIRTVRVRGLSPFQIIFKRVLRNALPQMLPKLTIQLASILSYVMIIEYIFEWPGVGLWVAEAIRTQNYLVIQTAVLVIGCFVLLMNVLSDIVGALTNPLIRKQWNAIQ